MPQHSSEQSQDNGPGSVTSIVTTGPDGAPLDEGSQQSTLSNTSIGKYTIFYRNVLYLTILLFFTQRLAMIKAQKVESQTFMVHLIWLQMLQMQMRHLVQDTRHSTMKPTLKWEVLRGLGHQLAQYLTVMYHPQVKVIDRQR
jgi:hypothetical protein